MQFVRVGSVCTRRARFARPASAWFLGLLFLLLSYMAPAAPTLERLRDSGVLRLGYVTAVPPFSYHDESGKAAGYAVALCERIAAGLRQELAMPALRTEFIAVEPERRFDEVQDGKIDLLCGGGTPTLSLRERVSFSLPIFPGGIGALVRKDAPARLLAVLEGQPEPYNPRWRASLGQVMQKRTFAVVANSRAAIWLDGTIKEIDLTATVKPVDSFDQGLSLVVERGADAVFGEHEILLDALRRSPAAQDLTVINRTFTFEPIAFALQRGDEDFRLLVDSVLSRLYRSGSISEVYEPSFGELDQDTLRFFMNTAVPE